MAYRPISEGDVYLNEDGNLVVIHADYDCESPREWNELSKFYTWHPHYCSPDGETAPSMESLADELDIDYDYEIGLFDLIKGINDKGGVALPVSMYDHSGVVYRTGSPTQFPDWQWDAGYVGLIYMTAEQVAEHYAGQAPENAKAAARKALEKQVDVYSEWANGNCWYYVTYDKFGEQLDSCGGFIGENLETNGLEEYAGKLNDCEFTSLADYVRHHANDTDVLLAEFSEALRRAQHIAVELQRRGVEVGPDDKMAA